MDQAAKVSRHMKYPYTFTAKAAQFPLKFHIQNSNIYKYYFIGLLVSMPVFYKIQKLTYHPANVAKWREVRREMYEGHHD